MYCTRGALLLFADADGATKFSDLIKLESSLNELLKGNIIALTGKHDLLTQCFS